ncbi:helix-turn-helix transcriptional regulator [Paraburkholderia pallida]|uniref:helix-turn-helix transcriptional regulator n=1 Tax=Paraburkholderia pallida TaxID=2547399 RepID=UPI0018D5FB08|nr:helix-turn-helix transcriptional regulator [Paraburkholderia pallida]
MRVVSESSNVTPTEQASRRSPRSLVQRREERDPAFREQMVAARVRAATSMFSSKPNSIAAARLQAGLSQTKLAEAIGTSQSHIAKIEGGKVQIQFSTAVQLADALNVTLDSLRGLIEQQSTNIVEVQ